MALKRDVRYPGRFTAASSGQPQGAFKNRTAPGALDGSYIEQDWANDWSAFFSSLLSSAGIIPNGNVDAVGASQYFDSLTALLIRSSSVTGTSRNARMNIAAASASATWTASEAVVKTALGGQSFLLSSVSVSINTATTGIGGMDTGLAPANGDVAVYLGYNPTTNARGLFGQDVTAIVAPEQYGGANRPTGFTSTQLIAVLKTDASRLFRIAYVADRRVTIADSTAVSTTAGVTLASLSIASSVPKNAVSISGAIASAATAGSGGTSMTVSGFASGLGSQSVAGYSSTPNGCACPFRDLPLPTPQNIWYTTALAGPGTGTFNMIIREYSF